MPRIYQNVGVPAAPVSNFSANGPATIPRNLRQRYDSYRARAASSPITSIHWENRHEEQKKSGKSILEDDPLRYKDAILYEIHVRAFVTATPTVSAT
jgi:pullulanase/glycogen debranching enzyme